MQVTRYLWPIYFIDFLIRVFIYNAFEETFWEFITRKTTPKLLVSQYNYLPNIDVGILVDLIALLYSGMEIIWYMVGNYELLPILVKMMRVFVVGRLLRGFRLPIFNKGVDVSKI